MQRVRQVPAEWSNSSRLWGIHTPETIRGQETAQPLHAHGPLRLRQDFHLLVLLLLAEVVNNIVASCRSRLMHYRAIRTLAHELNLHKTAVDKEAIDRSDCFSFGAAVRVGDLLHERRHKRGQLRVQLVPGRRPCNRVGELIQGFDDGVTQDHLSALAADGARRAGRRLLPEGFRTGQCVNRGERATLRGVIRPSLDRLLLNRAE
mmetsp:Transcript_16678/g.42417  ORF Transcript_16678/g.42417 Transcript_16678/m.42417 type:complete len:205 (-) Transcript_16678:202-816(-)